MTVRPLGDKLPRDKRMALPIYSVDTVEEGQSLCVLVGKLDYDGSGYRLPFSGEYDDIDRAAMTLHEAYHKIKARAKVAPAKSNKEE